MNTATYLHTGTTPHKWRTLQSLGPYAYFVASIRKSFAADTIAAAGRLPVVHTLPLHPMVVWALCAQCLV